MKTIKILLGIIAINLTLLTIVQTGVWPPKVQASETNLKENNIVSNDDCFAVASGGYLYYWGSSSDFRNWNYKWDDIYSDFDYVKPKKRKLP